MSDDPDLQPVLPADRVTSEVEQVRYGGLAVAAVVGVALIAAAIYWNVGLGQDDILPSALLELGAGTLLFVVLFGVERAAVRKVLRLETERLYRAMVPASGYDEGAEVGSDEQAAQQAVLEQAMELGLPPFDAAFQWVRAVVARDYDQLWAASDTNWQLCRAQAWVWNNRHPHFLDLDDHQCIGLSNELASGPGVSAHWDDFARIESQQFADVYKGINPDEWGVGSRRRVVAPSYEVVNLMPLGQYTEGLLVTRPLWIRNGLRFLMRWDGAQWLLASHTADAPPTPGLPPSWWVTDSVPEDALHFAAPEDSTP